MGTDKVVLGVAPRSVGLGILKAVSRRTLEQAREAGADAETLRLLQGGSEPHGSARKGGVVRSPADEKARDRLMALDASGELYRCAVNLCHRTGKPLAEVADGVTAGFGVGTLIARGYFSGVPVDTISAAEKALIESVGMPTWNFKVYKNLGYRLLSGDLPGLR